jgi:hypothetical protein
MVISAKNRHDLQQALDKLCIWVKENGFKINQEKQYDGVNASSNSIGLKKMNALKVLNSFRYLDSHLQMTRISFSMPMFLHYPQLVSS